MRGSFPAAMALNDIELRSRAERYTTFTSLGEVVAVLQQLAKHRRRLSGYSLRPIDLPA